MLIISLSLTISAVLWTEYGLLIDDHAVIIVNGFGILTTTIALLVYYSCGMRDGEVDGIETTMLTHLTVISAVLFMVHQNIIGMLVFSVIACLSSVVMYAAPLTGISRMIKNRDVGNLSGRLIFITFTVCFVWLIYGWRINDWYIIVPNGIGTIIGIAQASLLVAFGKDKLARSNSVYELLPIA